MNNVDNEENKSKAVEKVDVYITDSDGSEDKLSDIPYASGIVIFPGEWVPITGKKRSAI